MYVKVYKIEFAKITLTFKKKILEQPSTSVVNSLKLAISL